MASNSGPSPGFKRCEVCGSQYLNWCTRCREASEVEGISDTLDRFGLTTDNLVLSLASMVARDFWPATEFAFKLKGLGNTKKSEVSGPGGGPIPVSVGIEFVSPEGGEGEDDTE